MESHRPILAVRGAGYGCLGSALVGVSPCRTSSRSPGSQRTWPPSGASSSGHRSPSRNYSYVAPAGGDAVLKVTPAEDDESDEEADALELWNGDGAVRLLRRDRARRALLLERARPGSDISQLPEDEATAIAVEVGLRLWRPAAEPFRWIGDHVPRWLDQAERSDQEGRELIPLARQLYASLDVGRDVLVHGDFHHHNILRAGERHLAIDAKAMLGEPEYDVPSFLRNPLTLHDGARRHRAAAGGVRRCGARRGADACLGGDPLRLPRRRRGRGAGAARARLRRVRGDGFSRLPVSCRQVVESDAMPTALLRVGLAGSRAAPAGADRVLRATASSSGSRSRTTVAVAVEVGETVLEFRAGGGSPFYHFALLVPGDRFEAALAWAGDRVELLPDRETGDVVFDFTNWDAKAVYFHDPAGSIVELIAHRGRRRGEARSGAFAAGRAARRSPRSASSAIRRRLAEALRARARARALGRHRRRGGAARVRRREGEDADPLPRRPAVAADGPSRRGASGRGRARRRARRRRLLDGGGRVGRRATGDGPTVRASRSSRHDVTGG